MTAADTTRASLVQEQSASTGAELLVLPHRSRRYLIPSGRWLQALYIVFDVVLVATNGIVASALRSGPWMGNTFFKTFAHGGWYALDQPNKFYLALLMLYVGLVVLCCQGMQLYRTVRTRSFLDESFAVTKAVGLATLLLVAFVYLSGVKSISRLIVAFSGILNLMTLIAWRLLRRQMVNRRIARGVGARNVLIVGAGRVGKSLADYFHQNPHLGYVVKGFLDHHVNGDPRLLGSISDLSRVSKAQFVDEIFITIPQHRNLVKQVFVEARKHKVGVSVVPELFDGLGRRAPLHHVGDFPVMELHREPIPEMGLVAKRMLDVMISAVAITVTFPVLVVIAVAIKLDSHGPVLYCAPRVGKKGRIFKCYKLRTMDADADLKKDRLRHLNEREGPFFKIADDPRITGVGRWLRRYSLDELPQLWNVLKGDMSLVGPRPHPVDDFKNYDLSHLQRLDVCPGLTGLWQVTARRDPSFEKNMSLDLKYIDDWSFWLDMKILLKTIPEVFRASGS